MKRLKCATAASWRADAKAKRLTMSCFFFLLLLLVVVVIRPGVNGLPDVARVTYLQSVEDIYSAVSTLRSTHGLEIKVEFSTKRGYYLSIPLTSSDMTLPECFIQGLSEGWQG